MASKMRSIVSANRRGKAMSRAGALSGLPTLDHFKFSTTIQWRVSRPREGKCGLYKAGNGDQVKLCDTDCDYDRHHPNRSH